MFRKAQHILDQIRFAHLGIGDRKNERKGLLSLLVTVDELGRRIHTLRVRRSSIIPEMLSLRDSRTQIGEII